MTDLKNSTSQQPANSHTTTSPTTYQNSEVNPADDLYRHINGQWIDSVKIPQDKAADGAFHTLRDNSEEAVKKIIERVSAQPNNAKEQQVAHLYSAFMNEEYINSLGPAPAAPLLAKINDVNSIQDLSVLNAEFTRLGLPTVWEFGIGIDAGQPDQNLGHLFQGGLSLPDEAYYHDEQYEPIREQFLNYLTQLIKNVSADELAPALFGVKAGEKISEEQARKIAHNVLKFETDLASVHLDNVSLRDPHTTYHKKNLKDVKSLSPALAEYIDHLGIDPHLLEEIIVQTPDFFTSIDNVLNKHDLQTIKQTLALQTIHTLAPLLSQKYIDHNFSFFSQALTGTEQLRPRWKRGVSFVESTVGEIIGQLYVEEHFSSHAKEQTQELVSYLLNAYEESIKNLEWMSDATKEKALEKLSKFVVKIGYPDTWIDYSTLKTDPENLVENALQSSQFEFRRAVDKLGKDIDKTLWHMNPQTVNAYYDPTQNEIVFPAAILQPPFFNPDAPDAWNYGGIGAVIGHEIGHGFDDSGSQFDGTGALNNWWTSQDRAAFEERTQKLVDQYKVLSPVGLEGTKTVNGELTLGENIGDLGGLSIALKAFKMAQKEKGHGVTEDQLREFFYNWAAVWRQATRPEMAEQLLAIDPHSPAEFRCNAVVSNIDEFYEIFDVTAENALWLDPEKRTQIW